jgi:hypothetical protein
MSVVHHHDGAVLFRRLHQAGQRADVAIHGKDAIRDEQLFPAGAGERGQNALRRGEILVRERRESWPAKAGSRR